MDRLSYAGNEAARRYLNGEIDRKAAAAWLTRFALMSPPRAEQRTRFMDDYRSYVINYNLGKDLVRQHVEARAGAGADRREAMGGVRAAPGVAAPASGLRRPSPMIDSHCHLADEMFAPDLDQVVRRAKDAGVERVLVILAAGDEQEAAQAERLVGLWPEARVAVGVHPHTAHEFAEAPERAADTVRHQIARTPSARARRGDRSRLPLRLLAARRPAGGLPRAGPSRARAVQPVVIHTREADDDTLAILRDEGRGALTRRAALLHRGPCARPRRAATSASTSRWPASSRFRRPRSCVRPHG